MLRPQLFLIASLLALVACLIVGCAGSDVVQNPHTFMPKDPTYGFAAFSATCTGEEPVLGMRYGVDEWNFHRLLLQDADNTYLVIPCNKKEPQYFLLSLPASMYAIYKFYGRSGETDGFKPIYFRVYPQKVVYFGRLDLSLNLRKLTLADKFLALDRGFLKVLVLDRSQVDIPYFLHKYKNIPADKYSVKISE